MRKSRVLVLNETDDLSQFDNACIVSLSKTDLDDLKLLQQYLPEDLSKNDFTDKEKEVIKKYNEFIDSIRTKNKSSIVTIDFGLKKIKI